MTGDETAGVAVTAVSIRCRLLRYCGALYAVPLPQRRASAEGKASERLCAPPVAVVRSAPPQPLQLPLRPLSAVSRIGAEWLPKQRRNRLRTSIPLRCGMVHPAAPHP
eukprot:gene6832-biopygen3615